MDMSLRKRARAAVRAVVLRSVSEDLVARTLPGRPDVVLAAGVHRVTGVEFGGDNFIGRRAGLVAPVSIGRYTAIGSDCELQGPVTIGRYGSIGAGFGAYGDDHPMSYLTSYTSRHLFDGELKANNDVRPVTVGHGVWAGRNVIVLRGVTIGNGAVLGAGSVISSDVAPYSIVTGVPARHRRFRFDQEIIDRIEALAWWERSPEELEAIKPLFFVDFDEGPDDAKRRLEEAKRVLDGARGGATRL